MNAKPNDWVRVDPTPAVEAELVVGDGYRMDVVRGGATRSYTGTLVQAAEHWVVLRTVSRHSEVQGVPYLMDLPVIGWLGRNNVEVVQEDDVWIPREAATFRTQLKVPAWPTSSEGMPQAPPVNSNCFVDLVSEGKIFHSYCRLTEVAEKNVSLMLYEAPGRPQRELSRDYLLCVTIVHASHTLPPGTAGQEQE